MTDIQMYVLVGTIWMAAAITNTEMGRKMAGILGVLYCVTALVLRFKQ